MSNSYDDFLSGMVFGLLVAMFIVAMVFVFHPDGLKKHNDDKQANINAQIELAVGRYHNTAIKNR